jgi:multiple RNA-binding domain-containing protein 1
LYRKEYFSRCFSPLIKSFNSPPVLFRLTLKLIGGKVHIVQGAQASTNKGLAYVRYGDSNSAARALQKLDGASFQGRLLHILPALDKKSQKLDEYEISKLPLKKQKEIKRKREAASTTFSWNALYMNPDAVLSSVADRLGVTKAELLDPTSSDAAVKQAHAETHVIQETKSYLTAKGINIDAFKQPSRDDRTLLVKNFPFGVTTEELRQLLEPHGHISQLLMPSTGTMAIVQYRDASEAAHALKQLAYKNLKGSVLFLEKGPQGLFDQQAARDAGEAKPPKLREDNLQKPDEIPGGLVGNASSTLFVRNLNFATTTVRLKGFFEPLAGFLSARVKTKIDPKRPGDVLSMGFGFVDFRTSSQAQAAISVMNGHKLDNHELVIEASHRATDAAEERRRDDIGKKLEAKNTKVVIKNLPFEASKKDVRSLFGAYGQLRSVRVPKKFDHSTRGFAFADFVSAKEAENAIAALTNTHLLGRRLVLEFASGDAIDPEDEIRAMEQRISQQTDMVNLSKMTGSGRKKFTVDARDDETP